MAWGGTLLVALHQFLLVWGVPLLPVLFHGVPLPDADKTLSVPKPLLPVLVVLWAMALQRPAEGAARQAVSASTRWRTDCTARPVLSQENWPA